MIEIDEEACKTLRFNRPQWNVIRQDLNYFDPSPYSRVDVVAGGLPCPPFSKAGKQLGSQDERNLFPAALKIIARIRPRAVVIENVRGILDAIFTDYRNAFSKQMAKLGYWSDWRLFISSRTSECRNFSSVLFVALQKGTEQDFSWPVPMPMNAPTVGERLYDLMAANGWKGAKSWKSAADEIAPTIVGGSKKHEAGFLGTHAREARVGRLGCQWAPNREGGS